MALRDSSKPKPNYLGSHAKEEEQSVWKKIISQEMNDPECRKANTGILVGFASPVTSSSLPSEYPASQSSFPTMKYGGFIGIVSKSRCNISALLASHPQSDTNYRYRFAKAMQESKKFCIASR
ncbi:hypothetical protein PTTG_12260 [Puccinia triticina 1-1 BBBD Race 1]|uniref:Uncharacterized protein n=1 Tax=Puccinia triticina (isolate 1-1 / race 1 (BBBD)) TaxID=630390 RepID=A0A180GFI8_PUCT1|nr:hypothetical protein PTTG_12260 [Puccinia triticina 1-1 BBBD Race 1]